MAMTEEFDGFELVPFPPDDAGATPAPDLQVPRATFAFYNFCRRSYREECDGRPIWFFGGSTLRPIGLDMITGQVVSVHVLVADGSLLVENRDLLAFNDCLRAAIDGYPYEEDPADKIHFDAAMTRFKATMLALDPTVFDCDGLWNMLYWDIG